MSSDKRITEALAVAFANQPAVFWHDVEREFATTVTQLRLDDIQLVKLDECPALQIKLDIEADIAAGGGQRWLFYSNQPEPEPAKDWLLDVRLRARTFRADSTSILLEELGLTTLTLAPHLKLRSKFLRAKDRIERLKRLVLPGDDAEALDRKMMAVLLRTDESDVLALAMHVLSELHQPGHAGLADQPKGWSEIVTNELDSAFWLMMALHLGYREDQPALTDLLIRVLVTDLARSLRGTCPLALQHLVLPDRVLAANASVLAARWRTDLNLHASYAGVSGVVGEALSLKDQLAALEPEALADSMSFAVLDQLVIAALKRRLLQQGSVALEGVRALAARRRNGPWVNPMLASTSDQARALGACYDALEAAAEFMHLKDQHAAGLSFGNTASAVAAYRGELFKFDQLYRRVHHAAAQVDPMGWSLLHELRDLIEAAYAGWVMPQLSSAWGRVLEGPDGLLNTWRLDELPAQQRFFDERVATAFKGGTKRVFVVISDALRYEAAEELSRLINGKSRLVAQLDAMLGVLPSYTSLGMAALLPHQSLEYRGTDVWVDGQSTATLEARDARLAKYSGMAIRADELQALGKAKGRERIRDQRVVYVYHDRIDMLGDKQASEGQTFDAVAETIDELQRIVSFIIDSLNGTLVMVTADHGFIYQESALDEADKAALGDKPEGTLKAKKRYLLGRDLPATAKAWHGNTATTAGTTPGDASLDFWVPKGTMRFHFAGGARFVHGSAMPQEVIVPLLTVRESESAAAKTRVVDVAVVGSSNRVVTNTQRFEFIQSEPISARVLARTVLVSLRDGQLLISDEQPLTFDSSSDSLGERIRSVFLTVRAGSYDRQRDHYLVVRDAQSKVEILRSVVRIDLAFSNDF